MISLTEYRKLVDPLLKLKNQYTSKLYAINKKLEKIRIGKEYICNKCKICYSKEELGYKKYKERMTNQISHTQFEEVQDILCCPKCGRTFNIIIKKYNLIQTKKIRRPLNSKKLISKRIFKQ